MADTGEQNRPADAVIGLIPSARDIDALEGAIARIVQLEPPVNIALVHPPYPASHSTPPQLGARWQLIAHPQLARDPASPAQSLADSFRLISDTASQLGARACAIIASDLASVTPEWITQLLQPTLEEHFDLVAPCYAAHRFDGLVNRAIIYPLVRGLYGKRIRNPLGPDFGMSNILLERIAAAPKLRIHPIASLAVEAVTGGMKLCQTNLGPRHYAPPDWTNLGSVLAQVLAPLFLDVEKYAAYWQRSRTSQAIQEFGEPGFAADNDGPVDVTRLVESFRLGAQNLTEVWGIVLPPSTLVELRKLARHDAATFRMADETWARVVYDFALAHRLRPISRDQMLRAMAPIYLGWVASYALELADAPPEAVEQRMEKLCVAYENTKSYFVSRWRWPDRFNP
jgi:glucosylglycerate synthase